MTGYPLELSDLLETVRLVAKTGSVQNTATIQGKTYHLVNQHVKKAEQLAGIKFFYPYEPGCLTREGREYLEGVGK